MTALVVVAEFNRLSISHLTFPMVVAQKHTHIRPLYSSNTVVQHGGLCGKGPAPSVGIGIDRAHAKVTKRK